ncbi:hypothetical protein BIGA_0393 [Bifidobacterium pullorum subsp. gallinarum]|uniref:YdbS-like PH domain-containing protein n=1 Tax=Bifidobacterium pullorum subsp. gallinarum TaxID=78344 RepID=A0A087ASW2_9BIFI|nr:PH domain-containing protein [Bifidobacterium pullorum]KFI61862.1 hypothetical protein BIGA_0393 [Bifidobacterium pullorum subsp. gallinarum]
MAWRRLHPIAVVTALIESVRSAIALILPVLAIAVPNRDSAVVMAVIVAVIGLIAAWMLVSPVVRWLTTGYRMDDHGITQRSGVFNRTRTTIAYDHIHTLSSSAPIYMRPFHVVILDITAAGGESGMTLRGVPAGVQLELEAARQLDSGDTVSAAAASVGIHGAVADTAVADSDAAEECRQPEEAPAAGARTGVNQSATGRPAIDGELVFRASVADIVLFAVTDLGLFAALIVVYGFLDQLRDLVPEDVFDTAQDSVIRFATSSAAMIAGAVVVVFAVLVGASIIGSLLRFYGFEVWRRGGDLVVVRGALTRRITTIAIDRIQTVAIRRSLLRRALHLCSVRLGLGAMAAAEGEDGDATGADVLPVIGDDRVYAVLQRMLPEWGLEPPEIHRTGRGLVRYYLVMPLAVSAAGMAVAVIWALVSRDAVNWLWTLAPAALAVWWGLCRWLKAASEGYAVLDDKRIAATGASVLTLFTVFTRRSRIQSVERSSTPWRLNRGVECLRLPLFVSNGISALQFTALRSADAATVSAWAEDGSIRPSGTSDRSADSDPRNMTDNGHRDDDGWRAR